MRNEQRVIVNGVELHIEMIGKGFPIIIIYGGPGLDIHFFGSVFQVFQ